MRSSFKQTRDQTNWKIIGNITKIPAARYNFVDMNMKAGIILTLVLSLLILCGACAKTGQPNGILEGKVSIGPITPVQGVTPVPTPPEVYATRKVLVYDSHHSKLLDTLSLDNSGYYRIELRPGTYIVDINHAGADRSFDVPKSVEIEAGIPVVLNISIDTGLR
jgi:hypothetical protein